MALQDIKTDIERLTLDNNINEITENNTYPYTNTNVTPSYITQKSTSEMTYRHTKRNASRLYLLGEYDQCFTLLQKILQRREDDGKITFGILEEYGEAWEYAHVLSYYGKLCIEFCMW